jgi:hypothetical protein
MPFTREDAEKKCIDLQGKQYLEVKWRMVWFRENCSTGTIDTEEIAVDLDREVTVELFRWVDDPARPGKKKKEFYEKTARGYARFKATVTDGNGARATGTKSESAANFDDYIEKAETGAIGRALAALGYGTQFTGDELDEGKRIVDSPVSKDEQLNDLARPGPARMGNGHQDETGEPKQPDNLAQLVKNARTRAYKLGIKTQVEFETFCEEITGKKSGHVLVDIARINGELTEREKAASKGAA